MSSLQEAARNSHRKTESLYRNELLEWTTGVQSRDWGDTGCPSAATGDLLHRLGCSGLFALIKYFDKHPTASQIILQYMENKIGFKVEKNFYVTLETLPKNSFGLFDSGL